MVKIGRNAPCPCGSGKKYKRCCGNPLNEQDAVRKLRPDEIPAEVIKLIERQKAKELIRQQQQGLGNPIISTDFQGYRFVAVGNRLHYSKDWKTFHDFIFNYIRIVIKGEWGNNEIAKPFEERHVILQWYDQVCKYQKETVEEAGKVSTSPMIGVVEAYINLSYNLYLLGHNTIKNKFDEELQNRLINRLKNSESFPGALYESYVCACLIRAGFEVEFEDETDPSVKHCDFLVTCKASGKKYSVEAKSIRRMGALGAKLNTSKSDLQQSIRHQLHDALSKPSVHPRIIFVDVNLPEKDQDQNLKWIKKAVNAVNDAGDLTIRGEPTEPAFVILTNNPHHYHSTETNIGHAAVAVGYKIHDFGYGGAFESLRDAYAAKQKHIDINSIMDSLKTHSNIPSTFDGSLPSETFHGKTQRLMIGETYFFANIGENGLLATVTTATVIKQEKLIYIGTDKGVILTCPISDEAMEDYERHPDTFFGVVHQQGRTTEDYYELFEWMLNCYSKTPKDKLLELMKNRTDIEQLKPLSQHELAIIYCEGCVYSIMQGRDKKGE